MTKRAFVIGLFLSFFCLAVGAQATQEAYAIDMSGANTENTSTLRSITYSYDEQTQVYTYSNLLEEGCDVKFHVSNNNSCNNITFDNGAEADESPFTWYLPTQNGQALVAVFSHQDYTNADLRSFQTGYDTNTQSGYIVILNGKRSAISRVVKFGAGKHGEEIIEEVENIAAFKAKAQSSKLNLGYNTPASVYKISGPVTCIVDYVADNTWYYVQDETGTLAISTNHSFPLGTRNYKAGDVLEGITGYSVGTAADGYYMDLESERFYVYDAESRDAEKEYTTFPAPTGRAEVIAPKEINSKSEVTRQMNHDYVVLKNFTFEASKKDGEVNTLNCLKDATGGYFELSFDYVSIAPTDSQSEATNTFLDSVQDGSKGDFVGFLHNNTKNFMVVAWTVTTPPTDGIDATLSNSNSDATYDLSGRRAEGSYRGLVVKNGKKVLNRTNLK